MTWKKAFPVIFVIFLTASAFAGDETDAVKKVVLESQEAGWARYDFNAYMSQWADNARIVVGRGEQADKFDTVFDRKQIEGTRKIIMYGTPPPGFKVTFENVRVKVGGNKAELRVRTTIFFGEDSETADEVYELAKSAAGWKVTLNRGWSIKKKTGNQILTLDTATWKKLDGEADELVRTDKRGDRAAQALNTAYRFKEAHAAWKKVTTRKDAAAPDWLQHGYAALSAGDADDALSAFQRALERDPKIDVPRYVRDLKKK